MNDCIFCKIVAGDIPCVVVFQDDTVFAFMDIEAINPGHLLVIPKKHVPHVHEMDDDTYISVQLAVKRLSAAVENVFKPEKVGTMVSGWEVPHAHIHVVPMTKPSDITSKKTIDRELLHPSSEELSQQAEKVAQELSVT